MRSVSVRLLSALCALLFALLVPAVAAATSSQSEIDAAIAKALVYAPTQQNAETGEPPGYGHTEFYSGEWLASGYAAAGLHPADVKFGANPSLRDFLFGEGEAWTVLPPEYAFRMLLTADAAGIDTARISAEQNLPAELVRGWDPSSGGFSEPNTFASAWSTLALTTTPVPKWALSPALTYLRADQHADGGWSFYPVAEGEVSNPDITAAAVGALCGAGVPAYDPDVLDGLAYLRGQLIAETGAIENPEFGPNIDSASWTVNALNACGIDPQSSAWTSVDGKTPIDFILSLQLGDGGFAWVEGEPWFPPSTGHALRALAGYGFVVGPPVRQDPTLPRVGPVPAIAAGTPSPHVLAVELAPGKVKLCKVIAPVGAALTDLLAAARTSSEPPGCVSSFAVSGGKVTAIDGVTAPGADESWLVRLDRGVAAVAAGQPVGFGDLVSLRIGTTPPSFPTGPSGPAGPTGSPGPDGKRGARGKPARNAEISCRVRHRHGAKPKVRCAVKHKKEVGR